MPFEKSPSLPRYSGSLQSQVHTSGPHLTTSQHSSVLSSWENSPHLFQNNCDRETENKIKWFCLPSKKSETTKLVSCEETSCFPFFIIPQLLPYSSYILAFVITSLENTTWFQATKQKQQTLISAFKLLDLPRMWWVITLAQRLPVFKSLCTTPWALSKVRSGFQASEIFLPGRQSPAALNLHIFKGHSGSF